MDNLFGLVIWAIIIALVVKLVRSIRKRRRRALELARMQAQVQALKTTPAWEGYKYTSKNYFMTQTEHEFFDALIKAVGNEYQVFAQIHLSSLLSQKVVGQDWDKAFYHINGKSVDFLLCDKTYMAFKLAIELDDKSHERPDRQDRDGEVERILKGAGIPLMRLEINSAYNLGELALKVKELALK